jgi:hypothetical protein
VTEVAGRASPPASTFMELRHASTERLTIVVVPERRFFAIDGAGRPTAADFALATTMLRAAASVLRSRTARQRLQADRIGVVECRWWTQQRLPVEEWPRAFADRTTWHWQQLIAVPDRVSDRECEEAVDDAARRAGWPAGLVRLVRVIEGRAAQMLHVGEASTQAQTLRRLVAALPEAGLRPYGPIHELRLADDRDVPRERARSIIRLAVEPVLAGAGVGIVGGDWPATSLGGLGPA